MRARRRASPARADLSAVPVRVFTGLFVAAFAGIFVLCLTYRRAPPPVIERPYRPSVRPAEALPDQAVPAAPVRQEKPNPLGVEDLTWRREAFGAVAIASFAIRNRGDRGVQGSEFACTYLAAGGRAIAVTKRQLYEFVEAGQAVTVNALNIGLIPEGTESVTCAVQARPGAAEGAPGAEFKARAGGSRSGT